MYGENNSFSKKTKKLLTTDEKCHIIQHNWVYIPKNALCAVWMCQDVNSRNSALALLLLVAVVISSYLIVYSYEPSPVLELPVQDDEQIELNNDSQTDSAPVQDQESLPTEEESSVEEPSVDEPVRNPLENEEEEEPALQVVVTDEDGYAISGATVLADSVSGVTDGKGVYALVTDRETVTLQVKADGFVSFYEEIVIADCDGRLEITLEKADALRQLINKATLRPYVFADPVLTETVDAVLAEILTPGMDTYDKVKACYDWIIKHTVYKNPGHEGSGHWDCAYQVFRDGKGTCNCYSAAFAAMMRRIGLECYVLSGVTSANSGGMTGHVWTVIIIDGESYVFDPQVEDAIADRTSSKEIQYVRFCLSEPHVKYVYTGKKKATQMEIFKEFLAENGMFLVQDFVASPLLP